MPRPTRHYRVAERNKEMDQEYTAVAEENLRQLTLLGIILYGAIALTTFLLGYFVGKSE